MQLLQSALCSWLISSVALADQSALYDEYGVVGFENFGFEGYFRHVAQLDTSSDCQCELASMNDRTLFSGPNSPLDDEVSVHFRGPLSLKSFGYYVADSFTTGESSSAEWTRLAYYSGADAIAENVTFLTPNGDNSQCLGNAITYAGSNGTAAASSSTILEENNQLESDDEFSIFSNITCGESGFDNDCGVYRDGIPAYHGFYGETKMFLFEFTMPSATGKNSTSIEYYDMPAIWLLNAHIPRTAQYPSNTNCSCWSSGCGEFDIFEVMNGTETDHLYTTIHDFQGTGDIGTGIQAQGWILRDTDSVMSGGVVFDSDGTVSVFLSNSTSFNATISGSSVNSWISGASSDEGDYDRVLSTVTNTGYDVTTTTGSSTGSSSATSTSKSGAAAGPTADFKLDMRVVYVVLGITSLMFFV